DDRPYRAPAAAAVGARSARLGNLLGGTRPAGDDVGDDVPGGAGAQTHEHQRVTPPAAARPTAAGHPVAVRIIPGETGAAMCQALSRTYLRMLNRISGSRCDCTVTRRLGASPCPKSSTGLATVCRMPARPHRTVDRVIEILETVSLSPRGVSLAELAAALDAAKIGSGADQRSARPRLSSSSAIAGFTSGRGRSSSPCARTSWPRSRWITSSWPSWPRLLGCTVLVGVRVGDAIVFTDLVGEESPSLTFVARTHARRPLYTSAAGKTLLA